MKLDRHQKAWQQFKLKHSLESLSYDQFMLIIEAHEYAKPSKSLRLLTNAFIFLLLLLICQSG